MRRPAQRGQVLVLFAGALVTLLIIAALAFDVGMMLLERRDQQNAADAAALAGARYVLTSEPEARTAAARIAQVNGFDDAAADEIVNIYIPPIHGRYAGLPGFIEVQIEATRASIFGGIIGRAAWPIGAYAVATNRQDLTFPFGMLALDPTACKAIQVSGGGYVEAYSSIQANSNGADCDGDPISFSRTGGSTITVGTNVYCRAVGDIQDQGSGTMGACIQAPDSFALPDPLRNLPAPTMPARASPMVYAGIPGTEPAKWPKNCPGGSPAPDEFNPTTCKLAPTGGYADMPWILYPGLYPGGLEVTAGTTAYLMPGIYWLGGGGLRVATGGSIVTVATEIDATPLAADATWGGGVLIYNSRLPAEAGAPIVLDGSAATMLLKPLGVPSTDPDAIYNDIVVFQDRALTTSVTLNGSASTTEVEGIVYVPGGEVKLNGNGGTLVVDQIIANTYLIDGNGGTIKVMRDRGIDAVIVAAGLVE
jgi:hypothetical protein